MKATIKVEQEVDLKTLHVKAEARYWEDTKVNGVEDIEGELIPCRKGDLWCPIIELDTGKILNWEAGKTAEVHYKICDAGSYYIKDINDEVILSIEQDYVPSLLCPDENGYGDYIIMNIDENGVIENWEADISDFEKED